MNSNGKNRFNTFAGDVEINGDLTVTGTINGGGSGSDVQNPMTSNLDGGNFNITNVNTLNVSQLTTSNPTQFINCNSKVLSNLSAIQLNNGLLFSSSIVPEENYVLSVAAGSAIIEYKKAVFNPVEEDINMDGKSITNVNNIQATGISSLTGATAFTSILNMFNDVNMNYNDIFNVDRLTCSHAGVSINLDMIPATQGLPGQILARNPAFVPGNFSTHKLVWVNQASGNVTNPLTSDLQGAGFSLFNTNVLECKNVNIITGGSGLSCANGLFPIPITWGLAQKLSLSPFYQTFNTDYITPASNLGLIIDSKAPDGVTDSKITLSAPNIILNNSTNLTPSLVTLSGNIQITNGNGYIHGNDLVLRGRTSSNIDTPLTLSGTTISYNSSTNNFNGTIRTNTIDTNTGGNISILQNLTLASGRQIRTDLVFSDGLRSYTNDLILAGLLPDNKTQTNIILASPQISLNNQFGPLTQETQVNIAGNIIFNNPVTQPFINGSNLTIRGRNTSGIPTTLALEGSAIVLVSTGNINMTADNFNFNKNISLFSGRGVDINPSIILYRTVGSPSTFDIRNGATYVNVTNGQTSRGNKSIPANGLLVNDLYKFNLIGLMTCDAKIDMTFSIFSGTNRICTFTLSGDALTNQGFEFTTTLCVRLVSTNIVNFSGIGKFEKDGKQISYAVPVNNTNMFTNVVNTFDIYIKPVSTMITGSVTIYNFSIENI